MILFPPYIRGRVIIMVALISGIYGMYFGNNFTWMWLKIIYLWQRLNAKKIIEIFSFRNFRINSVKTDKDSYFYTRWQVISICEKLCLQNFMLIAAYLNSTFFFENEWGVWFFFKLFFFHLLTTFVIVFSYKSSSTIFLDFSKIQLL